MTAAGEKSRPALREGNGSAEVTYVLRLYIAGRTPKSIAALDNLHRICEEYLKGKHRIEIVDLLQEPLRARVDQILAIPTLVRMAPPPMGRIIGDLSDAVRVLKGLLLGAVA
jgi:circadian clock protein KaiB